MPEIRNISLSEIHLDNSTMIPINKGIVVDLVTEEILSLKRNKSVLIIEDQDSFILDESPLLEEEQETVAVEDIIQFVTDEDEGLSSNEITEEDFEEEDDEDRKD